MKDTEKFTEVLGLYLWGSRGTMVESEQRSDMVWACTVGERGGGGTTAVTQMTGGGT